MPLLKAGEREAIVGWWDRSIAVKGLLTGVALGLGGFAVGSLAFAFLAAFNDLN